MFNSCEQFRWPVMVFLLFRLPDIDVLAQSLSFAVSRSFPLYTRSLTYTQFHFIFKCERLRQCANLIYRNRMHWTRLGISRYVLCRFVSESVRVVVVVAVVCASFVSLLASSSQFQCIPNLPWLRTGAGMSEPVKMYARNIEKWTEREKKPYQYNPNRNWMTEPFCADISFGFGYFA